MEIHTTFLGGGFGRRATPTSDFVREAVQVAKADGTPVKVVWTREDDMRGGYYRPGVPRTTSRSARRERDAPWRGSTRIVGQSILAGTPFEAMLVKNGIDATSVEGVTDSPYLAGRGRPARRSPLAQRRPVPVLWWRSVGHSHTAFVMESLIDELAHAAGKDPARLPAARCCKRHPRHLGVLNLAAEKAGWGTPCRRAARAGLAVHESFGSYRRAGGRGLGRAGAATSACTAWCARSTAASRSTPGDRARRWNRHRLRPRRGTAQPHRPSRDGRVEQTNFHDYQVLRIDEMPTVEVHIVPSGAKMGGIGEPGTPPIAPAVANAVFALTGKRLRTLPFRLA